MVFFLSFFSSTLLTKQLFGCIIKSYISLKGATMSTISENKVHSISGNTFFKDFVFTDLVYRIEGTGDGELSDCIIYYNKTVLQIQVKERDVARVQETWFEKKVKKKANNQHNAFDDTCKSSLNKVFVNDSGNSFKLSDFKDCTKYNITIFDNPDLEDYERIYIHKHKKDLEPYNIISLSDFNTICYYLMTPESIVNYLKFRIEFLLLPRNRNKNFTEKQIISNYSEKFIHTHDILKSYIDEFRRFILNLTGNNNREDYRKLLSKIILFNTEEIFHITKRLVNICTQRKNKKFDVFNYTFIKEFGILFCATPFFDEAKNKEMLQCFSYCKKLDSALVIEVCDVFEDGNLDIKLNYEEAPFAYCKDIKRKAKRFEKTLHDQTTIYTL